MVRTRQLFAIVWMVVSFLLISQTAHAADIPLGVTVKTLSTQQLQNAIDHIDLIPKTATWVRIDFAGLKYVNGKIETDPEYCSIFWKFLRELKDRDKKIWVIMGVPKGTTTKNYREAIDAESQIISNLAPYVDVIQVGNEMDCHDFIGYTPISGCNWKTYDGGAYLKRVTYFVSKIGEAVQKYNDRNYENHHVALAVNLTSWPLFNRTKQEEEFIEKLSKYVDVVGLDLYPDASEESIEHAKEIVGEFKANYRNVVVSETGMSATQMRSHCSRVYTEEEQAKWLPEIVNGLSKARPAAIIIYMLQDVPTSATDCKDIREAYFGIVRADGTKKPAYYSIFGGIQYKQNANVNKEGIPTATITVCDCTEERIGNRILPVVGGACKEYDVNVTPNSIEYNLVVSFAEGSTKTFAGRGDQRFTVRWSIHAPVPNPEGVPSISNPPVCAKVIYRGEVLASTCGNEAPAKKGENEGAEWKVSVKSPYPYSYRFRGNVLLLDINVNYTARNACYSVYAVVTPIRCPNCYDVYIRERRPAPGEMCAQVIRQIPVVTAKIGPLSRATKSVYVVVHGMNGIMPEQNTIYGRVKCAVIEKELANLKKMLEQCRVSRNCSEKEILQELREKEAELWSECNYKPKPTTPPIAPKPIIINPILPVPPRFKVVLSTVPVNVVKRDNSVVIEGKEASAKVLSTLIVSDGKLIDKSSGITINVAPDSVAKKIRKKTGGEIEAMALENIGGKPTYVVRVKRRIRVWVFTIDIPEKAVIDASSGAVITVEKPWYAGILRIFGWQ